MPSIFHGMFVALVATSLGHLEAKTELEMEAVERRENRQQPLGLVRNPAVINQVTTWLCLSSDTRGWAPSYTASEIFGDVFELWCPRTFFRQLVCGVFWGWIFQVEWCTSWTVWLRAISFPNISGVKLTGLAEKIVCLDLTTATFSVSAFLGGISFAEASKVYFVARLPWLCHLRSSWIILDIWKIILDDLQLVYLHIFTRNINSFKYHLHLGKISGWRIKFVNCMLKEMRWWRRGDEWNEWWWREAPPNEPGLNPRKIAFWRNLSRLTTLLFCFGFLLLFVFGFW